MFNKSGECHSSECGTIFVILSVRKSVDEMNLQINRDDYHHICAVCINEKMNVESFRKSKDSEIKI